MEKQIKVEEMIQNMKRSPFLLQCGIPLGYVAGLPIMQIRKERLCMLIPFLKYKVTGQVDKTLVYPIRYTVTMVLPEEQIIEYQDLAYQKTFSKVNFSEPIGTFRHDAVKHLNKTEYRALLSELWGLYDKMICMLLENTEYSVADDQRIRQLMMQLTEPSLFPIYKALDEDFYNKYMR